MARDNQYQALARAAAERIDQDRQLAEQLTLLPDGDEGETEDGGKGGTRGKGKALSQFREWLAARGYQLPEDQIARIAGLSDGRDPIEGAMADAERILAWAETGAVSVKGSPAVQSMAARLQAFERCYAARLKAAEALLPYGLTKATPDAGDFLTIPVLAVPAAPAQAPQMRDVTPVQGRRMMPADVAHQIEQNQQVTDDDPERPTGGSRTE